MLEKYSSICKEKQKTIRKCDFLLINDTKRDAYLIEVKGTDLLSTIEQLEKTEEVLGADLKGYQKKYRIVYRHKGNVKAKTDWLEEEI